MNEWMDVGPRLVRIDFDLFSRYLLKRERNEYLTNRFEAAWNVCELFPSNLAHACD